MIPGAIVGVLITVTGNYKPLLIIDFLLMSIDMGPFIMLEKNSSTTCWAAYQSLLALGSGIAFIAALPTILASLPEFEVGTAT